MGILCAMGLHKWRTTQIKSLPPVLPNHPAPAYLQCRCMRCGKQNWWFYENRPSARGYDAAVHGRPCTKHTSYDGLEVTVHGPCDPNCFTTTTKPRSAE